jgi:adenosylmethionine-8-amino-7-oxononanoate aminotransferase
MPPLSITPEELETLVRVTGESIQAVLSGSIA